MTYGKIAGFIRLPEDLKANLKVRLNDNHGKVLKEYLNDRNYYSNNSVLWYSGKSWFEVGDVFLSLLRISGDDWILTSIHKVVEKFDISKKTREEIKFGFPAWRAEILPEFEKFYGTLHIKFHREKRFQSQVMHYKTVEDFMEVASLESESYSGEDFPGCDRVKNLSGHDLKRIFELNKSTWVNGLSNSKAIYLVRDKKTGKMYVGSAASDDEMLLSRWKSYAADGHGGNKIFKKIVQESGIEYVRENFEYSILEPHDYRADTNFLLERENHWKEMLHTRADEGGMNLN